MFQRKHHISKVADAAHKAGFEMAESYNLWKRKG